MTRDDKKNDGFGFSFSNLIAGPSSSRSFLHAQVMIISCAFQKNWDFSGRIPMKTFLFLHVGIFNLVRQPFDYAVLFLGVVLPHGQVHSLIRVKTQKT